MMTPGLGAVRPIGIVLFIAVAALALAACGSEDATPTPEPTATQQPGSTPTQAAEASPTASTPASSGETGTRTVEHAMGATDVPVDPQRVVVLDMGEMDMALALGVQPVGAALYNPDQEFAEYLQPRIDGYTRVGTVSEPDLEAIAALDPDLIISNKTRHEDIYDELSRIAPTVFAEALGADWKPQFETVARALGREDRHAEVMGEYWDHIDRFQEAMGDRLDETHVTVVRSFPDHVRLYMKDSFIGTIIEDAGLPRPEPQDKDKFMEEISAERTRDLAADVIFELYWNPSEGEQLSQITENPLWDQLAAVEAGQVYEMDDEVWGTGLGPMAAMEVIEDLDGVLVEGDVDASVWSPEEEFPVTIEHKYGSTTIEEKPERVVTVGFSEQDPVLALGAKPVAVREWFGGQPNAVWPWAQEE
ncbi:MAG: ABC transporter substrate-binding protein, partial [Chloroflexota bacterium]